MQNIRFIILETGLPGGQFYYYHSGVSLLLTTVPIMYRYTVLVVNRESVDYHAFWCNGLEGNNQACLQLGIQFELYFLSPFPRNESSKAAQCIL